MNIGGPVFIALVIAGFVTPSSARASELNWKKGPPTLSDHAYHASVYTNGKYYALPGGPDSKFEVFDPTQGSWRMLPSPTTSRDFAGAASIGNQIYLCGGVGEAGSRTNTASVEMYDIEKASWSACVPMNVARSRLVVVAAHDRLFAIGGFVGRSNEEPDERCVEAFDPIQKKWSLKRPMPTARHGHFAVVVHDRIWVLGGFGKFPKPMNGRDYGPLDTVEVYDPLTDEWSSRPSMPTPSGFSGASYLVGERGTESLFVVGGHYDVQHVVRFDLGRERWDTCSPAPAPLTRFALSASRSTALITGGEHSPRETWWLSATE